jgi:hypothetical protein
MEDNVKKQWKTTSKKIEEDLKNNNGRRPQQKNGRGTNQPKST